MKIKKLNYIQNLISLYKVERENLENNIDYVIVNKLYLSNLDNVKITNKNLSQPHYEFGSKTINIPLDYKGSFSNSYKNIQSYVGNQSSEYIIFHEIGHAIQHSSIGSSDYRFEPVEIKSKLNYLFNGASVANKINHFLSDNFKESYADCYAAFSLYKKYGDISVFDKVYNYREFEKTKFKTVYPNGINEYFNHEALLIFKNAFNKDEPFEKIHECIQSSIVKAIFKTLIKEMQTNDAFLKEVKNFGLEFNKSPVRGFLKEFKDRSNGIIQDDIDELLKNPLFIRNVDSAEPLNAMRKNGHNFVNDINTNIQAIRKRAVDKDLSKKALRA